MKLFRVLFFFLSLCPFPGFAQAKAKKQGLSPHQVHSLSVLGELWGFLKYYHPAVVHGQQNWDSVLIQKIPLYLGAKDKDAISRLTADWLTETGTPKACQSCDNNIPDSCKFNLDLSWISNANFSRDVAGRLQFIRDNRSQGSNRFVRLEGGHQLVTHEPAYNTPAYLYPPAPYRLLLLFRFWNIVQYFSPYKYLCGKDWKKVLEEEIPAFYGAADTLAYHLEYVKLISSLNDGHANFYVTPVLRHFWGDNHYPPFYCEMIDGKLVVGHVFNDSLAALIRIKKGDVLVTINGEKVTDKMARLLAYGPASNDVMRVCGFSAYFLFTGPDNNFIITKERKGLTIIDTIGMPTYTSPYPDSRALPWRLLEGNIGYVDMGILQISQVDTMMDALAGAKGIIFDVRNYPNNTARALAARLCDRPFVMASVSSSDLNYPGVFRFEKIYVNGNMPQHPYRGKVVLLADVMSVSHSEWTIMTLQASTKTMTIGSTTAGQDGDVSNRIVLLGGLFTRFSSLGIYYPDGTPAQRAGVKIDRMVHPTIRGLQEGRDEVLEAGIKFINGR